MFYKSSFLIFSISLKIFAIFTPFSFNFSIIFTINSINVIFFNITDLIVNLFYIFIIKIKKTDIMLKKEFNSNKKTYIKNEEFDSFSRK